MRLMKKFIIQFFVILILISCNQANDNVIRVGVLNGPSAMSFVKMMDEKQLVQNRTVQIIIKDEPQQIQALMMQGKLDFAVLPTIMAANLYNKGVKYKMMAGTVWGSLYMLSNNPQIRQMTDLKHRTIGVFGQGATADVLLQREIGLKRVTGLTPDYTYTNNATLGLALENKLIENAILSEPLVSILMNKDTAIHIVTKLNCQEFLGNSDVDIFAQSAFLVKASLIEKDEALIDNFNQLYINSCNSFADDTTSTAGLLVKYRFFKDIETAKSSIKLSNIRYVSAFAIEKEISRYLRIFYEFDPSSIGGKMPDENFLYCKDF